MRIMFTHLAVLAFLFVEPSLCFSEASCRELKHTTPERMVEYLQQSTGALSQTCVAYAIDELGSRKHVAAAEILTKYLDFPRPGTELNGRTNVIVRIPWLGDYYPAVDALFEIGRPAIPSLIRVLGAGGTSDLARRNAVGVVGAVFRDNVVDAVVLLNDANRSAEDPGVAGRLLDAAKQMVKECPGSVQPRCQAVLWNQVRIVSGHKQ